MSARNTLLFGAALAVTTAAIAYDHVTKPVPPRPAAQATASSGSAPCAAGAPVAPCAAGAPAKAPPPPPPAQRPADAAPAKAAPPAAPLAKPAGQEAPELAVDGT
jgi:hypothetical protein